MKTRIFEDKNYKAVYLEGKTLRFALKPDKPILELDYPEFYDIKITNFCEGHCPWCYQDSKRTGKHYCQIVKKAEKFFGHMTENEKPFQVAIGGGNPNQHPEFIPLLKYLYSIGITPNYTTNGMGITEKILDATAKYCGGVAVSCHPHLRDYWQVAVGSFIARKIRTNLHLIISDKQSIDEFLEIYHKFAKKVDYFVLLPYTAQGRAKDKDIDCEYLIEATRGIDHSKIAFGANFYNFLLDNRDCFEVSLYSPEILSKYLDMKDMKLYKSSFNLTEWKSKPKLLSARS